MNAVDQSRIDAQVPETGTKTILGLGDMPFETTDAIKAFAMYLAGHPFYVINTYTIERLKRFGFTKGMTPTEASIEAVRRNEKGVVRYIFPKYPDSNLLKAFDEQHAEFEDKIVREGKDVFKFLADQYAARLITFPEFCARAVCLVCKMRNEFMNAWKKQVPWLRIRNQGETTREKFNTPNGEGEIVRSPGFVELPANASEEIKKGLGVA